MSADMAGRLSAIREQLRVQKRALHVALERNEQLARQDTLTELPNRRHATEMMEYEERRSRREKVPPAICMLDIDHFKQINDNFGHAAGDKVLRLLAKQALTALRSPDILARWGGEEFVLIMPETTVSEAIQVVERLRVLLAGTWVWKDHPELRVTFSAGVAALQNSETIQDTVARADEAMYLAKQQGRNRTIEASLEAPKSAHQKLQLVASR
jgi:diguanylate cyclase (GGDEF)-like protein